VCGTQVPIGHCPGVRSESASRRRGPWSGGKARTCTLVCRCGMGPGLLAAYRYNSPCACPRSWRTLSRTPTAGRSRSEGTLLKLRGHLSVVAASAWHVLPRRSGGGRAAPLPMCAAPRGTRAPLPHLQAFHAWLRERGESTLTVAGTVFMWAGAAHAAYVMAVPAPLRPGVARRNAPRAMVRVRLSGAAFTRGRRGRLTRACDGLIKAHVCGAGATQPDSEAPPPPLAGPPLAQAPIAADGSATPPPAACLAGNAGGRWRVRSTAVVAA
jgi:hypothetical protein